jgi:hypothetical protein
VPVPDRTLVAHVLRPRGLFPPGYISARRLLHLSRLVELSSCFRPMLAHLQVKQCGREITAPATDPGRAMPKKGPAVA